MANSIPDNTNIDTRPFAGLRVIEFGTVIAGPFAGSLMADLGAEVIKIEQPGTGDVLRSMGHRKGDVPLWWGVSARDKRCVTLNVKAQAGKDIFRALIAGADVLIENNRPGVLQRLGFAWDNVHAINSRLIMLSISGFGQTGPQSQRPGFGKVAEGMSGLVHLTGTREDAPMFVGFSLADACSGLFGVLGIAMALYQRDVNGGAGALVDVALFEPLMRMMDYQFVAARQGGTPPIRSGLNDPYGWGGAHDGARYQSIRSADDWWHFIRVDGPAEAALTAMIGLQTGDNPDTALRNWAASVDTGELCARLLREGVEIVPIFDGLSLSKSTYMQARGDAVAVHDEAAGSFYVPGPIEPADRAGGHHAPFRFREVGGDNAAVYGGLLGLDQETLAALHKEGVI